MIHLKKITIVAVIICLMFSLVGCAKCISTEYENVEVTVKNEYYRGTYQTPVMAGKVIILVTHPAVYEITVEYDGVEYTISGSDTYNKYKEKVGQTAIGILETRTYDDGSVRYDITNLK